MILDRTLPVLRRRLLAGGLLGAGTFLVTGLVTAAASYGRLLEANEPAREVGTLTETLFPPLWKAAGWVLFGAHQVPVRSLPSSDGGDDAIVSLLFWLYRGENFPPAVPLSPASGERPVRNLVALLFDGLATVGLFCLPAVALTAAGFLLGRAFAETYGDGGLVDGGLVGGWLAVGYLPCSLLVGVATRAEITGYGYRATVGVALPDAALLAGLAYPLVFGGLGGFLSRGLLGTVRERIS